MRPAARQAKSLALELPRFLLPLMVAHLALPTPIAVYVGVLLVIRVASRTVGLGRVERERTDTPPDVHAVRNWLKVRGIAAQPVPAEVVDD